jgi:hypothetical protein
MRVIVSIVIVFVIVICCKPVNKNEYKVDRIVISKSNCRPIFENLSDTGFGQCPEYAISIDENLNFLITKGSVNSSKLNSFSGEISQNLWDSLYFGIISKLLLDTNNYDLHTFLKMLYENVIIYDYTGPEYLILLYFNDRKIKTLHFIENDLFEYRPLFEKLENIKSEIELKRINDTSFIDLNRYLLMPPRIAREQDQIKYKY